MNATNWSTVQQRVVRVASRALFVLGGIAILAAAPALPVTADSHRTNPTVIPLPNGWRPEGIASGRGTTFFAGSLANGALYRGDLRTGVGAILYPGAPGRVSAGLKHDSRSNYVFVAGGPTGAAYIYDGDTGTPIAVYQLSTSGSFVNDVVITRDAAYFTDSFKPVLYRLPLAANGQLPDPPAVETIALGGDFAFVPGTFNTNGIDATPNGKTLVIVQSNTGALYTVDPATGFASRIDLGGDVVTQGDGILLDGKVLYVVRNRLNQIAVVDLSPDMTSGAICADDHRSELRRAYHHRRIWQRPGCCQRALQHPTDTHDNVYSCSGYETLEELALSPGRHAVKQA